MCRQWIVGQLIVLNDGVAASPINQGLTSIAGIASNGFEAAEGDIVLIGPDQVGGNGVAAADFQFACTAIRKPSGIGIVRPPASCCLLLSASCLLPPASCRLPPGYCFLLPSQHRRRRYLALAGECVKKNNLSFAEPLNYHGSIVSTLVLPVIEPLFESRTVAVDAD